MSMLRRQFNSILSGVLSPIVVRRKGEKTEKEFYSKLENIEKSQTELLLDIIRENQDTDFGKKYGFSDINTVSDYRAKLPVLEYEAIRPYIEEQDRTGKPVLLAREPEFFAVTSGTTGKPKFIPVHDRALVDHKSSTNLFIYSILKARPKLLSGKILAIVSPAVEGHMEDSGKPFGSTSGHMYESLSSFVKNKYVVPAPVFSVSDYDLKYELIMLLAMMEKNVTYFTTANPSTISKLVKMIPSLIDIAIETLETGKYPNLSKLPLDVQVEMSKRIFVDKKRASELRVLKETRSELRIQDLWPNLQAVATWTGGSCSIFLDQLKGQFSEQTLLRDPGYLSSEFRGSLPLNSDTNAGVPTILATFYEFVQADKWDSGEKEFLMLHELEDQEKYYVFVTTSYGLYRYNMNDIVQVEGSFEGKVPQLRFVQKGKGVTSITGEKLYENQVIATVHKVEREFGVDNQFFVVECDPETARYSLYYELSPRVKEERLDDKGLAALKDLSAFEKRLDEVLREINMEYDAKRSSDRVKPIRLALLKRGSYEDFKRFYLAAGQREGQFKIVALQYKKDIKFDFAPSIRWDSALTEAANLDLVAASRHASKLSLTTSEVSNG